MFSLRVCFLVTIFVPKLPVRAGTAAGGEASPPKAPGLSRIQSEGVLTNMGEAKSGFAVKQRGLVAG